MVELRTWANVVAGAWLCVLYEYKHTLLRSIVQNQMNVQEQNDEQRMRKKKKNRSRTNDEEQNSTYVREWIWAIVTVTDIRSGMIFEWNIVLPVCLLSVRSHTQYCHYQTITIINWMKGYSEKYWQRCNDMHSKYNNKSLWFLNDLENFAASTVRVALA